MEDAAQNNTLVTLLTRYLAEADADAEGWKTLVALARSGGHALPEGAEEAFPVAPESEKSAQEDPASADDYDDVLRAAAAVLLQQMSRIQASSVKLADLLSLSGYQAAIELRGFFAPLLQQEGVDQDSLDLHRAIVLDLIVPLMHVIGVTEIRVKHAVPLDAYIRQWAVQLPGVSAIEVLPATEDEG